MMNHLLFWEPALAMPTRQLLAYGSVALAVVGIVLFLKYLPRWIEHFSKKPPETGIDPAAGLAAGLPMPGTAETGSDGGILVLDNGIQHGPFSVEQVRGMRQSGTFNAESLCWRPGQADWKPLDEVLGEPPS